MRVIAGKFKGRPLKAVPGNFTRPTADKIKESVFQMIGPFFDGGKCLDLFAGSGSLGIEAISRGIDNVLFIDKHPRAIQTINENINKLKIEDQTEVFRMDAFRALRVMEKNNASFDIILLDPPYDKMDYIKIINEIVERELINMNGLIICEHDPSRDISHAHFEIIKQVKYSGTIAITILKKMNKIKPNHCTKRLERGF